MNSDETLRKNVTRLREEHGWSIQDLASRLNMDRTYLSKSESGNRAFKISEVDKLAKVFGVSTDYLLGRSEPSQENTHTAETVEQALSHVMSFDGKPVTDHDRAVLQQIAEAYLKGRDPDEDNQ